MSRVRTLAQSFGYARDGVREALKLEPNFRIHVFMAIIFSLLGLFFGLTLVEWLLLLFAITFVITMELVNTVLEALVDLVSPEIHKKAKYAKDVSAAAVMLSAFSAIIVGIILFLPHLINLLVKLM